MEFALVISRVMTVLFVGMPVFSGVAVCAECMNAAAGNVNEARRTLKTAVQQVLADLDDFSLNITIGRYPAALGPLSSM